MPQFDFFAPGEAQLGGILVGAHGILAGGQAKGAGLAAEGQALGQAYTNIGKAAAVATAQRAEEAKVEQLQKDVNAFADKVGAGDLYEDRSFTFEEDITDPSLATIRDETEQAIARGMDPSAAAVLKQDAYSDWFQMNLDLSPAAAADRARQLVKPQKESVLKAEARGELLRGAAALKAAGVPEFAIRGAIDAVPGASGFARDSDYLESRKAGFDALFELTLSQERAAAVRKQEDLAAAKEQREQTLRARAEQEIQELVSQPLNVPTPLGMIPTGARTRDQQTVSVASETGAEATFVERAQAVGLPTEDLVRELREGITFTPIGESKLSQVRELLRRGGYSEAEIPDQLKQRKLFSGPNDPLLQEILNARQKNIERTFLQDAPRFSGGASPGDAALFERIGGTVGRNIQAGKTSQFVTLGQLDNLDIDGIMSTLSSRPGNTTTKELVEATRVRIGDDGRPEVVSTRLTAQNKRELEALLEQRIFTDDTIRDEVMLRQATGSIAMTRTEVNKFMQSLRTSNPEIASLMARSVGEEVPDLAPGPGPAVADGLTDAQRALLSTRSATGAVVGGRRIDTAESVQAAARRRTGEAAPPTEEQVRKASEVEDLRPQFDKLRAEADAAQRKAAADGDEARFQLISRLSGNLNAAMFANDPARIEEFLIKLRGALKR